MNRHRINAFADKVVVYDVKRGRSQLIVMSVVKYFLLDNQSEVSFMDVQISTYGKTPYRCMEVSL